MSEIITLQDSNKSWLGGILTGMFLARGSIMAELRMFDPMSYNESYGGEARERVQALNERISERFKSDTALLRTEFEVLCSR